MSDRIVKPTPADNALYDDITALIKRHLTPDTPDRVLAIAAQIVGKAIALQDQRVMTPDRAMEIVRVNIEMGNRQVLDSLLNNTGGSA